MRYSADLPSRPKLRGCLRRLRVHEYLARPQQHASALHIVVEGWAARYKLLFDGRRQITRFYLRGDLCDPAWLSQSTVVQPVVAMTSLQTISLNCDEILSRADRDPLLMTALWEESRAAADMQSEWAFNLGRKTARERLAHLFCEITARLETREISGGTNCELPLSQKDIADFTGLTPVHVSRTLKEMRSDGLIEFQSGTLKIADVRELAREASFKNDYLGGGSAFRDFVQIPATPGITPASRPVGNYPRLR